jgi:uncharacterized membrane protein
MTFLLTLAAFWAMLHVPPLPRLLRLPSGRDKARVAAALGFMVTGVTHFTSPERFLPMMPPFLPAPLALIYLSGAFELLGAIGLLLPATQRAAAWGLVALLVAVFPANIYAALTGGQAAGMPSSAWYLWSRLPFQAVYIWWLLAATRPQSSAATPVDSRTTRATTPTP